MFNNPQSGNDGSDQPSIQMDLLVSPDIFWLPDQIFCAQDLDAAVAHAPSVNCAGDPLSALTLAWNLHLESAQHVTSQMAPSPKRW